MSAYPLNSRPIHLGLGATAEVEPAFTNEMSWYEGYLNRHESDGTEARLVSLYTFSEPWPMWEMHPNGAEVVLCTEGEITLHQEDPDGTTRQVVLKPGEYVINGPGVWHTADTEKSATALFITAGVGTEHRPR